MISVPHWDHSARSTASASGICRPSISSKSEITWQKAGAPRNCNSATISVLEGSSEAYRSSKSWQWFRRSRNRRRRFADARASSHRTRRDEEMNASIDLRQARADDRFARSRRRDDRDPDLDILAFGHAEVFVELDGHAVDRLRPM